MRITIDTDTRQLTTVDDGVESQCPLYSPEAFRTLSRQWIKVGWELKYTYGFSWMGRPIIQLPEDLVRIQEVIFDVSPDVIIETGVAHGGSLIFYASLFRAIGKGRVIGVDIEIRPHNRRAIEAHPLAELITLVEGNAVEPAIVSKVRSLVKPNNKVLILLDSNHTRAHVASELEAYAPLVTRGSYIIATDGLMVDLDDVPRGRPEWKVDNPMVAAAEFAKSHPDFELVEPSFPFNEGLIKERVTHWPGAFLRRVAPQG